mmetsp:Transcript_30746/g.100056  ORF Transcript_30746/g.100056 Transcript_30746/m.100056 type:complete len:731 (+) Transcript_30746:94-2286(+)
MMGARRPAMARAGAGPAAAAQRKPARAATAAVRVSRFGVRSAWVGGEEAGVAQGRVLRLRSRASGKAAEAATTVVEVEASASASSEPEAEPAAAPANGGRPLSKKQRARQGGGKKAKQESSAGASSIASGVRLEGITKAFKNQVVLDGVSLEVAKGERAALVGFNGAGKTTLLKVITGELQADSGDVLRAKGDVGFLTQEFEVDESRTVREEFMSVFGAADRVRGEMDEVEKELSEATDDMDRMTELLEKLDKLQRELDVVDVSDADKRVDQMMPSLGFVPERDNSRLVSSYSGGWQMRMSLGKILLQKPDLLLLDEPTNHLDLETIQWLEGSPRESAQPMIVVSHDREFLDQISTKTIELDMGKATTYKGNYSEYLRQKQTAYVQQMAAYERQQKEISRKREMIQRLEGGAQSGRAEAAKKELEKMEQAGLIKKPWQHKSRPFTFPEAPRSGKEVVTVQGLTHGYGDRTLFEKAELTVLRGERIALVGPNGAGKSTLLRLLMGSEEPTRGSAKMEGHQLLTNYFQQNQAEALDLERSVLETLTRAAGDTPVNDLKNLLGRMGFGGKSFDKPVKALSGGEKARLAMAKFMVTPANVLILDEPTNHLDIPTKEMLEEALQQFEGTVIAASHDRYFLRQITTRVVDVQDGKMGDYDGDFNYYLEKNQKMAELVGDREEMIEKQQQDNIKAKSKMSKAEKAAAKAASKKQKAQAFANKKMTGQTSKMNNKRWN